VLKAYDGVDVMIHIFVTSTLIGVEWSASRPCRFILGERTPGTHFIGGWVDPRVGVDDVEKRKFLTLPALELRPIWRSASRYTDYAMPAPSCMDLLRKIKKDLRIASALATIRTEYLQNTNPYYS
jgi:hypothetical protein